MVLSYGETEGLSSKMLVCYLIFHTIYLFVLFNVVSGFDGIFFYLVAHVLNELKMVKVAFSNSKIKPSWGYKKRLKLSVQHHKFILEYAEVFYFLFY